MEGLERLTTEEIRTTSRLIAPDSELSQWCQLFHIAIRPPTYHPVELRRFDWSTTPHPCYTDHEGTLRSRHFDSLGARVTTEGLIVTVTNDEGNEVELLRL